MDKTWSLKSKDEIDIIFTQSKSKSSGCILAKWVDAPETKFLFAVSSKTFKRANKRNRIKRSMRVSVSAIKDQIKNKHVAFIYRSDEVKSYKEINSSIMNVLNALK